MDESGYLTAPGHRLSVIAAVLTSIADHEVITEMIRAAQFQNRPWHFYDETPSRRIELAAVIAAMPLHGGFLLAATSTPTGQERARARILTQLRPTLQFHEQVEHVVMETRGGGDKHDRRTLDRLRRSRTVTSALRIDHRPKREPLLQLADFVASAYVSAQHHGESRPWDLVSEAHPIELLELPPR
nr:hypothetical protein [Sciscionella sp. SE31]